MEDNRDHISPSAEGSFIYGGIELHGEPSGSVDDWVHDGDLEEGNRVAEIGKILDETALYDMNYMDEEYGSFFLYWTLFYRLLLVSGAFFIEFLVLIFTYTYFLISFRSSDEEEEEFASVEV